MRCAFGLNSFGGVYVVVLPMAKVLKGRRETKAHRAGKALREKEARRVSTQISHPPAHTPVG
jgi:hypothetical protein